jgi:hypothetical protein
MELVFQASPRIVIATNTFINVPVILKYEDTPLLEVCTGLAKLDRCISEEDAL